MCTSEHVRVVGKYIYRCTKATKRNGKTQIRCGLSTWMCVCVLVFVAGFLIESFSLDIKAPYLIWLTFTIRHTLFYTLGEEDSLQKDRNRQAPVTVAERK